MTLDLKPTKKKGLSVGITSSGKKYSVRDDRGRYFTPDEWNKFMEEIRDYPRGWRCKLPEKRMIYETLLQTGGRIAEILHLKPSDVDFKRNTITLRVTKKRSPHTEGKSRTFLISRDFIKKLKHYISENNIDRDDLIFPIGQKGIYLYMRRVLERAGFEDAWNFSLHNIRKTTGNWLKTLGVPGTVICLRLGHDINTYIQHYSSNDIFTKQEKIEIAKILGTIYIKGDIKKYEEL